MGTLNLDPGGIIKADRYQLGNGQELGRCLALVNFNGLSAATIRKSVNISSVVRNGTGDYTVNFATPLPDADYVVTASAGTTVWTSDSTTPRSTTSFRMRCVNSAGTVVDNAFIDLSFFG